MIRKLGLIELVVMVLFISTVLVWVGILCNGIHQHQYRTTFSQRWAPVLKMAPAVVFPPKRLLRAKDIPWPCSAICKATV